MILRLLSTLLLAGGVCFAQAEGKALQDLQKAFRASTAKKASPAELAALRRSAIAGIGSADNAKIAEALADAWLALETDAAAAETERQAANAELVKVDGQREVPKEVYDKIQALRPRLGELRKLTDELRGMQEDVQRHIGELHSADALGFLLDKVLTQKKDPMPLRLAAGRAVGSNGAAIMGRVQAALERARDAVEVVPLIDAVAAAGAQGKTCALAVMLNLKHKDEFVRERAALALSHLGVAEAIEPMIGVLEQSEGQMRTRVAAALEVLTGKQFGANPGAWRGWWTNEGAQFVAGAPALGSGTPSHRKDTNRFYYFGIPQDESHSIVYVIDCSGSMTAPVDRKTAVTTADGSDGTKETRLEACKRELIAALGKLEKRQKFAILWYSDLPHWYQPQLQAAEPAAVAAAQTFVRTLHPESSTNIHDSLELCFTLVGRGAHDKYYEPAFDTIFLLTDGSPTTNEGKPDSTEKILAGVRQWNALKRVTIHAIGIGNGLDVAFLTQLAKENGGEFKQF